jgi:hypothetical protein
MRYGDHDSASGKIRMRSQSQPAKRLKDSLDPNKQKKDGCEYFHKRFTFTSFSTIRTQSISPVRVNFSIASPAGINVPLGKKKRFLQTNG